MKTCSWVFIGVVLLFSSLPDSFANPGGTVSTPLTPKEDLGNRIYFDTHLSAHMQSCASCHTPNAGFADPDRNVPTSEGAIRGRFGNRNSPTAAYAAFSPEFRFDTASGRYIGGQFWDGRAKNLEEQAKGPFLNPLEMNNPSKAAVIAKIQRASYANLFLSVFGPDAWSNTDRAYDFVVEAIAAFERTAFFNAFTSKFDAYLLSTATLTPQEQQGFALFTGKGRCHECHTSSPGPDGTPPLFTNFLYENLGIPRNPNNPFYRLSLDLNPDGANFIDYGLGAIIKDPAQNGKFKVPTLRNVAITAPYFHNGIYSTLFDVVQFHNRKYVGQVVSPEVDENVNWAQVGNLGLSDQEINDLVAFLGTLTDGYFVRTTPPTSVGIASSTDNNSTTAPTNETRPDNPAAVSAPSSQSSGGGFVHPALLIAVFAAARVRTRRNISVRACLKKELSGTSSRPQDEIDN